MISSICIFEDPHYSTLYPLTLTRPVFDLRCGIHTLKDKIIKQIPSQSIYLLCRDYLREIVEQQNPSMKVNEFDTESCLFVNGRIIGDTDLLKDLSVDKEVLFFHNDILIGAFLKGSHTRDFAEQLRKRKKVSDFKDIPEKEVRNIKLINYPWDLVNNNASEIENDFNLSKQRGKVMGRVSDHAVVINKSNIFIGKNALIHPGVVLNAENGSIFIAEEAEIMSNAVIQGPAFIGRGSKIKIGAKIYAGTSIGEICKVGGEVEDSIIHSYSNKQHDGFLGHAYLGEWVNIGAGTNNSDLKNNYSNVSIRINGNMIDSGSLHVGLIMGDHSKTGINMMFNTGTVVGVMCNIFGSDYPPRHIPSFSWGSAKKMMKHKYNKAVDTARTVMERRNKKMTPDYEGLLKYIYTLTEKNRTF